MSFDLLGPGCLVHERLQSWSGAQTASVGRSLARAQRPCLEDILGAAGQDKVGQTGRKVAASASGKAPKSRAAAGQIQPSFLGAATGWIE